MHGLSLLCCSWKYVIRLSFSDERYREFEGKLETSSLQHQGELRRLQRQVDEAFEDNQVVTVCDCAHISSSV